MPIDPETGQYYEHLPGPRYEPTAPEPSWGEREEEVELPMPVLPPAYPQYPAPTYWEQALKGSDYARFVAWFLSVYPNEEPPRNTPDIYYNPYYQRWIMLNQPTAGTPTTGLPTPTEGLPPLGERGEEGLMPSMPPASEWPDWAYPVYVRPTATTYGGYAWEMRPDYLKRATPDELSALEQEQLRLAQLDYELQARKVALQEQQALWEQQQAGKLTEAQEEQLELAWQQLEADDRQFEQQLAWEKEKYGLPGVMSEYEKEALRLREEEGARSYELDQKRYELDEQELEWRIAQDGQLTAWQEEQLGLARQELEAQTQQQAWQRDISEQELAWAQQRFGQEIAFEREQFAWQQEETRRQAEEEQRRQLIELAAHPINWLQFSLQAGQPAVVQPFMLPLATEQYPELQAGQVIPGWPTQAPQPTQAAQSAYLGAGAYPTGAPTYPTGYTQPALPSEAEMWASPPQTQQYTGLTPSGIPAEDWAYRQSKVSDWAARWVAARSGQSVEEARADLAAGLSGPEFGGPSVLHALRTERTGTPYTKDGEPYFPTGQEFTGGVQGISDPAEIARLLAGLKQKVRMAGI